MWMHLRGDEAALLW